MNEDRKTEQNVLRSLDAEVHSKVMGATWPENRCRVCGWVIAGIDPRYGCTLESCSLRPVPEHRADEAPHYSTDIGAAIRVEDRIAELGKQNDYIAHLWDEVGAARDGSHFWTAQNFNAFWLCVHATPEQRCRAALHAMECLSINNRNSTRAGVLN